MSAQPQAPVAPTYRERLWPGPLGWSFVLGFAGFVLIALLPVEPRVAAAVAAAALVAGLIIAIRTSTAVMVRGGELHAGRAHIPVDLLGSGRVLDRAGVRTAVGPGSDARAFVCLRSWVAGAVQLDVVDPQDPTPSWLVSSRRPTELLAAVDAARGRDQAAHSEQIS